MKRLTLLVSFLLLHPLLGSAQDFRGASSLVARIGSAPVPANQHAARPPHPKLGIESVLNSYYVVTISSSDAWMWSENSVAIDPNNPHYALNSNITSEWDYVNFDAFDITGVNAVETTDYGQSWSNADQYGVTSGVGGANNIGDPSVAIDRNGNYYVNFIAGDANNPQSTDGGLNVAVSSDRGQNWAINHIAANPCGLFPSQFLDKPDMTVDNGLASFPNRLLSPGRLYCAWSNGCYGYSIQAKYSTDHGAHWNNPTDVVNGEPSSNISGDHQGVCVRCGPDGTAYAV